MNNVLHNPVYHALVSGDKHLGFGTDTVKFFDEEVSPFAGFEVDNDKGFGELFELFPPGRKILFATPSQIAPPEGWELRHEIKGLQFVYDTKTKIRTEFSQIIQLDESHIGQMIALAKLTKPGPFGKRTIEFGYYFGIFDQEKLVAMTGQRLHPENFTEVSAVCTHPDHTGKGYAFQLMQHQLCLILQQGQQPFLHVREDNLRAITLYQRLGFTVSRPMNFYFLKRQ